MVARSIAVSCGAAGDLIMPIRDGSDGESTEMREGARAKYSDTMVAALHSLCAIPRAPYATLAFCSLKLVRWLSDI